MGSITVRKENEKQPAMAMWEPRWEPFRLMRDLMGWDPFREMSPFQAQLPAGFVPSFEVKETKDAYVFKADLPGVRDNDLNITITGNRLTIAGKREAEKQEQHDTYYAYERSYGSFTRSFTLPEGVDMNAVAADLKEGVLSLSVKKKPEAQPRKVEVQTPAKKS
jgi:HSP20 family protein